MKMGEDDIYSSIKCGFEFYSYIVKPGASRRVLHFVCALITV